MHSAEESASESKKASSEPGLAGQTLPKERRDLQVAINLTAPFLLAQAVGPGMLSPGFEHLVSDRWCYRASWARRLQRH